METTPDFSYDIEIILRSFKEAPDVAVRIISLRSGSAVDHFARALNELKKVGRIPANVEICPVIGFSTAAWEEGKADVHDSIIRGIPLLVPATDAKQELSREIANRHGARRVLRFECGG